MERFFTADLHLGHARIIELSGRPFESVEQMNEELVARACEVVGPEDELWVLGDLALGTIADSLEVAARLPGRKHLVVGNHDRTFLERSESRLARFAAMYESAGFTLHPGSVGLTIAGRSVLASHFPYGGDSQDVDRYVEARPIDTGLPLLHGHIHENAHIRGRQFNVGVDVNGFRPVSEERVIEWLRGLADERGAHEEPHTSLV